MIRIRERKTSALSARAEPWIQSEASPVQTLGSQQIAMALASFSQGRARPKTGGLPKERRAHHSSA